MKLNWGSFSVFFWSRSSHSSRRSRLISRTDPNIWNTILVDSFSPYILNHNNFKASTMGEPQKTDEAEHHSTTWSVEIKDPDKHLKQLSETPLELLHHLPMKGKKAKWQQYKCQSHIRKVHLSIMFLLGSPFCSSLLQQFARQSTQKTNKVPPTLSHSKYWYVKTIHSIRQVHEGGQQSHFHQTGL